MQVEHKNFKEAAIWDDSFKYAGKIGLELSW